MTSDKDNKNSNQPEKSIGSELDARLAKLNEKLKSARPEDQQQIASPSTSRSWSYAFRIASDLIAGPLVGGFIGWWLDNWLQTAPIFLIILFLLGLAAGFLNVIRTAQQMNASDENNDNSKSNS